MYVYTVYICICIYIYEWIRALLYMFEEYVYIPHVSPDFWGLLKEPPINKWISWDEPSCRLFRTRLWDPSRTFVLHPAP